MPIDPFIIIILCITLITGIFVGFALSIYRYIRRLYYIKNFKEYISVLEYHMDKAYDIVHKDKILAYSLDAYRIPEEDIQGITAEFGRLAQKFIGPSLLKEFVQLYGNEDTFIFIVLDYFGRRYEGDEIRKTAMDNLTQEE
jgi:hypothetical protein